MSYKPDHNTLISYLFEELDAQNRLRVEAYLKNNPEAQKELKELKATLGELEKLPNEPVETPKFIFAAPKAETRNTRKPFPWAKTLGLAASVTLIFFLGYLSAFRIQFQENTLSIGFGPIKAPIENPGPALNDLAQKPGQKIAYPDTSKIKQELRKEWQEKQDLLEKRIELLSGQLSLLATQTRPRPVPETNEMTEADFSPLVDKIKEENFNMMLRLVELSNKKQQEYTEELLQVFAQYQEKRIKKNLGDLELNISQIRLNQIKQQNETDYLMATLINNVQNNSNK